MRADARALPKGAAQKTTARHAEIELRTPSEPACFSVELIFSASCTARDASTSPFLNAEVASCEVRRRNSSACVSGVSPPRQDPCTKSQSGSYTQARRDPYVFAPLPAGVLRHRHARAVVLWHGHGRPEAFSAARDRGLALRLHHPEGGCRELRPRHAVGESVRAPCLPRAGGV